MQNAVAVAVWLQCCKRTEEAARTKDDEASLNQSRAAGVVAAFLSSAACPDRPEGHMRLACAGVGRSTCRLERVQRAVCGWRRRGDVVRCRGRMRRVSSRRGQSGSRAIRSGVGCKSLQVRVCEVMQPKSSLDKSSVSLPLIIHSRYIRSP